MPSPALLLLAVAGIASLSTTHSSPTIDWMEAANKISCLGKSDGFYMDTVSQDNAFYRCKDSIVVEHVICEAGSRYNPQTRQCVPSSSLEIVCDPAADGLFTLPGTLCRGYYRCRNGSREDFRCPRDSYFEMSSQVCVRTGGMCHELVCSGRVNGHYPDTTHDCRRSYTCEGGILRSLTSCAAGTLFNGSSCEVSDRVKCPTTYMSAVSVRILPTDPCANLPDGYQIQEDDTCPSYHLCLSGQTIAKLKCAPGHHFNGLKCEPVKNNCSSYCAGKPDGFATDLRRQCRGYVNCVDGKIAEELSCKDGSLFNGKTCVPAVLYQCPLLLQKNICSKLKDGYHQDYMTGCKEYFYCHEGQVLFRSACRGGRVWNGTNCVVPSEFLCRGPEVWPGCSGVEHGLYPDTSQNSKCKFYHYCSNGQRVRLSCSDGFIFNGKVCVRNDSYSCPKLDSDCYDRADGYYPDPNSDCRSYFYCLSGYKHTYICPGSLVFNGMECVDQSQFKCTTNSDICKNKTNGYHADETTGCHKYMYCLQGVRITTLECPESNVFNGKTCIPFKVHNCSKTTQSCEDVEDGLYSEPNSQCTSYFKCLDKKKTKTFTCREGKVFNGEKCVKYICPSKNKQLQKGGDCLDRIGFFQDYDSRCNKYYFCINGVKTMLSCNRGQVFNGELCVSQMEYNCPIDA